VGSFFEQEHKVDKHDAEGVTVGELVKLFIGDNLLGQMQIIPIISLSLNRLELFPSEHLGIIHPCNLPLPLSRDINRLKGQPQMTQLDDLVEKVDCLQKREQQQFELKL
jgi:hypothetical protein